MIACVKMSVRRCFELPEIPVMSGKFRKRKRKQVHVEIAPCQSFTAFVGYVNSSASGNHKLIILAIFVEYAFEIIFPFTIFMDFVEYYERFRFVGAIELCEKGGVCGKKFSVRESIPVKIYGVGEVCGHLPGKRGFPRLSGPRNDYHFSLGRKGVPQRCVESSCN